MLYTAYLRNKLLTTLSNIRQGQLKLTLPDGSVHQFQGPKPGQQADLQIDQWRVIVESWTSHDIGFARSYSKGWCHSNDLAALLIFMLENKLALGSFNSAHSWFKIIGRLCNVLKANSLSGSKKNIFAHYDLGNEFYRLWLDPTMTYSSALYLDEKDSLEQAQKQKYHRILHASPLSSGSMLEIGCGWGGFVEHAQSSGDWQIDAITLSPAQLAYARERLSRKARIRLCDYRQVQGRFDRIVSIEMLEAVGESYWKTYFAQLRRLLKPAGSASIQTITIKDELFSDYRKGTDMLRTYIFPGGMLASKERLRQEAARAQLRCSAFFCFGSSYYQTLRQWLIHFDRSEQAVEALGFDATFRRLWRFYLCACMAGFFTGRIDVVQFQLTPNG